MPWCILFKCRWIIHISCNTLTTEEQKSHFTWTWLLSYYAFPSIPKVILHTRWCGCPLFEIRPIRWKSGITSFCRFPQFKQTWIKKTRRLTRPRLTHRLSLQMWSRQPGWISPFIPYSKTFSHSRSNLAPSSRWRTVMVHASRLLTVLYLLLRQSASPVYQI